MEQSTKNTLYALIITFGTLFLLSAIIAIVIS
jgi:hypothetical protein